MADDISTIRLVVDTSGAEPALKSFETRLTAAKSAMAALGQGAGADAAQLATLQKEVETLTAKLDKAKDATEGYNKGMNMSKAVVQSWSQTLADGSRVSTKATSDMTQDQLQGLTESTAALKQSVAEEKQLRAVQVANHLDTQKKMEAQTTVSQSRDLELAKQRGKDRIALEKETNSKWQGLLAERENAERASIARTSQNATNDPARMGYTTYGQKLFVAKAVQDEHGPEAAAQKFGTTLTNNIGTLEQYKKKVKEVGESHRHVLPSFDMLGEKVKLTNNSVRELFVMLHEYMSGYTNRIPGSLISLFSYSGLSGSAMIGLATRVVAPVGALAVLAKALNDGAKEFQAMNMAMVSTGNISGQTSSSMRSMSEALEKHSHLTIAESKAIVTEAVASGKVSASAMLPLISSVGTYAKVTGDTIPKATGALVKALADPKKGAEELNSQFHFLSVSEQTHIENLQAQGKWTEAQTELANKFNNRMGETEQQLNKLQSVWERIRKAASGAWDSMEGMGRPVPLADQIKLIEARQHMRGYNGSEVVGGNSRATKSSTGKTRRQIDDEAKAALQSQMDAEKAASDSSSAKAVQDKKDKDAQDIAEGSSWLGKQRKLNNDIIALKAQRKDITDGKSKGDLGLIDSGISGKSAELSALLGSQAHAEAALKLEEARLNTSIKRSEAEERLGNLSKRSLIEAHTAHDLAVLDAQLERARKLEAKDPTSAVNRASQIDVLSEQRRSRVGEGKAQLEEYDKKWEAELLNIQARTYTRQHDFEKAYLAKFDAQHRLEMENLKTSKDPKDAWRYADLNAQRDEQGVEGKKRTEEYKTKEAEKPLARGAEEYKEKIATAKSASTMGTGQLYTPAVDRQLAKDRIDQIDRDLPNLLAQVAAGSEEAAKAVAKYRLEREQLVSKTAGTWQEGLREGMSEYAMQTQNYATLAKAAFVSSMNQMESALEKFATTGKLNFRSLAASIMADLARMTMKAAMSPLFTMLGTAAMGLFSSAASTAANSSQFSLASGMAGQNSTMGLGSGLTFNGPRLAKGGEFSGGISGLSSQILTSPTLFKFAAGSTGLAGEAGPEAIVPLARDSQGRLGIRNSGAAGNGAVHTSINVTVHQNGQVKSETSAENSAALGRMMDAAVLQVIEREKRPGGTLYS